MSGVLLLAGSRMLRRLYLKHPRTSGVREVVHDKHVLIPCVHVHKLRNRSASAGIFTAAKEKNSTRYSTHGRFVSVSVFFHFGIFPHFGQGSVKFFNIEFWCWFCFREVLLLNSSNSRVNLSSLQISEYSTICQPSSWFVF